MRSLLVRIFVSFWSIIVITIVAAGAMGYFYAERARDAMQTFEVSDAMLQASASLRENGRDGLTEWLRSLPGVTASLVFVLDERGQDLIGRRVPSSVAIAMRRFGRLRGHRLRPERDFGNLRPARPLTQLVGPDDHVYTFFVLPPQSNVRRWMAERGRMTLGILALIVSAGISYLLARAISQPIRRFRESAIAIGEGKLDTRVADRVGKRGDEIGLLARDFDRMTDELQRSWLRQTELTRNVSHELRSPLARLRVALELARRKTGELPELEKIDKETERLDELIGQILEFSRLDADPAEARTRIKLEELVQSVVEDARYEFGAVGDDHAVIEIESVSSCVVDGFASALTSGVENVLRNAIQHGKDDGAVRVRLQTEGTDAVISISDEGGGVAEHELERIFDPFYRSRKDGGRVAPLVQGSGLGLAIAARAIAVNGGSVSASNTSGGLCITIRLPIVSFLDY